MTGKTKIGLIGCGRWGRNILRDLLVCGCDVYVAEHGESGRIYALDIGAKAAFAEYTEFPDALDGYVVAVQTDRHFDMLKRLAPTGKPIFIEKPMVPDRVHALEIQALMGERVFVMHKWRYHPGIQMLRTLNQEGTYGKLHRLTTNRVQWKQPHDDVDAFWILMPHDVSIAYHIIDDLPDVKAVQAQIRGNDIHELTAFLGPEPSVTLSISDIFPETQRHVIAYFDQAVVSLPDPLSDQLEVRALKEGKPSDEITSIPISTEFPLLREIKAFIAHVETGAAVGSLVEDEMTMMQCLTEMRRLAFDTEG
ncbi:Gfo/Idh/MocA family protein [Kordiimonas sp.]|uniref:Gfo/Idh/MocA family protein n=1 Tax=Kordiimonas sp. TaxID=1970157 RepID=UPI003A945C4A